MKVSVMYAEMKPINQLLVRAISFITTNKTKEAQSEKATEPKITIKNIIYAAFLVKEVVTFVALTHIINKMAKYRLIA